MKIEGIPVEIQAAKEGDASLNYSLSVEYVPSLTHALAMERKVTLPTPAELSHIRAYFTQKGSLGTSEYVKITEGRERGVSRGLFSGEGILELPSQKKVVLAKCSIEGNELVASEKDRVDVPEEFMKDAYFNPIKSWKLIKDRTIGQKIDYFALPVIAEDGERHNENLGVLELDIEKPLNPNREGDFRRIEMYAACPGAGDPEMSVFGAVRNFSGKGPLGTFAVLERRLL